jgi:hypothetical protein
MSYKPAWGEGEVGSRQSLRETLAKACQGVPCTLTSRTVFRVCSYLCDWNGGGVDGGGEHGMQTVCLVLPLFVKVRAQLASVDGLS